MNKQIIFFDLDGTIIDVSERSFQVYKQILKKYNKNFLSKKKYIRLKQEKKPIKEILRKTKAEDILPHFVKEWNRNIEKRDFLALDELTLQNKKVLLNLKKRNVLVLVTLRNSSTNFKKELKDKKIINIFDEILVKSGKKTKERWKIKYNLIRNYRNYGTAVIIGDTETDIIAGKKLGLKTIAVTSGMRSRSILKKCEPDCLIKNISEIKKCNF